MIAFLAVLALNGIGVETTAMQIATTAINRDAFTFLVHNPNKFPVVVRIGKQQILESVRDSDVLLRSHQASEAPIWFSERVGYDLFMEEDSISIKNGQPRRCLKRVR